MAGSSCGSQTAAVALVGQRSPVATVESAEQMATGSQIAVRCSALWWSDYTGPDPEIRTGPDLAPWADLVTTAGSLGHLNRVETAVAIAAVATAAVATVVAAAVAVAAAVVPVASAAIAECIDPVVSGPGMWGLGCPSSTGSPSGRDEAAGSEAVEHWLLRPSAALRRTGSVRRGQTQGPAGVAQLNPRTMGPLVLLCFDRNPRHHSY